MKKADIAKILRGNPRAHRDAKMLESALGAIKELRKQGVPRKGYDLSPNMRRELPTGRSRTFKNRVARHIKLTFSA
jgi:hypothetical protein